jgi:hypothetical protein
MADTLGVKKEASRLYLLDMGAVWAPLVSIGGKRLEFKPPENLQPGEAEWLEALWGKANELYERYVEFARTRGSRLKVMIIDFPCGMRGYDGLFLNWHRSRPDRQSRQFPVARTAHSGP